ncbi:hypothetical protein [Synechococcus sp. PCC 6312]|uniref:hypothetical protein n=1 Tax=Synechococcus sp. (strain ATCC 27167 / PCC 6312) TaxID=195253 RepID=UPI00029EF3DD|nr:hypothetical protein [Synechococcus sp. PCC 6312]AFY60528.1 hypothetical protein Syn6312_1356 [Synechococcus sp. PCC 6312]
MATNPYVKRSVLWGAYRLKVPKQRAGAGREVKTRNLYSYVNQGTVDRIKLRPQQLVYPAAYLLKTKPSQAGRGNSDSVQPRLNSGRQPSKTRTYLWKPKVQRQFSNHIKTVGVADYNAILKFTINPNDARFSQIGIPTGLSFAKMASNLARFTEVGVFKARSGNTFVLTKGSKNAIGRNRAANAVSEKEVKPSNAVAG